MSENTPPSFAIRENLKTFYDLTGIEVEILTDDLPVVQQKVGIDLRGGKADFHLNYVQDKPIGAPFADFYARTCWSTPATTRCPRTRTAMGEEAWFENFLDACGSIYEPGRLVAFPYDCAVACTFYRQDLFEQLSKDFEAEYGYRMEFTPETTWKQLYEFAAFFKKLREGRREDVPYGYAQHQGTFAWTTQLDIQRMLFAHGRWTEFDVDDKLGSKTPGPTKWGDEQSVLIMQKFKEQADVCHPDNLANGTLAAEHGLPGRPDRDAGAVPRVRGLDRGREDHRRAAGGKTAYAPCPRARRPGSSAAARWSTAAIAASAGSASTATRRTTSSARPTSSRSGLPREGHPVQRAEGVGGTPTRKSVLEIPEVQGARKRPTTMPNALTFAAVYDFGIKDPNFVLGPKIPEANEYHQILATEVQKCITGKESRRKPARRSRSRSTT